ncbi:hypothetical protein Tco_0559065, partial [Tanacetum coccineum]
EVNSLMQQVPDYYGLEVLARSVICAHLKDHYYRFMHIRINVFESTAPRHVLNMITLGAIALGAMGPVTMAGQTVDVVGAAVVGAVAAKKGMGKYVVAATDELGEDFHKLILSQEPF